LRDLGIGFRDWGIEGFREILIEGFRNSGNENDRIPSIPKFPNSQFLNLLAPETFKKALRNHRPEDA
jgi:hypothetical protein